MSERVTRVPAISTPTDTNLRDVARQIKSVLDVREGYTGDPLDRFVTFRDIASGGIAETTTAGREVSLSPIPVTDGTDFYDGTTDSVTPPAPENFTATGLFASVLLEWDAPRIRNYAYAEIYRSETDAIGTAALVGTSRGTQFTDYLGLSAGQYYWARFVTQANVFGPFNSTSGTFARTALNPALLIESLQGQITESELYETLGSRIDQIDAPGTGLVTQVSSLNGKYTVKIDNNGYVTGFGLASEDNNGVPTSEFIIRADRFAIASPTGPGITPTEPFIVQTTPTTGSTGTTIPAGVYINDVFIKDASITSAKIGSVDADTIRAGFTSSVDLVSSVMYGSEFYIGGTATYEYNYPGQPNRRTGIAYVTNPNIALRSTGAEFNVDYFKITNGSTLLTPFEVSQGVVRIASAAIGVGTITSAKIADTIQSTNFSTTAGWQINKASNIVINDGTFRGTLSVRSASSGGRMEITNSAIKVYDETGALRVQLGNLSV